MENLIDVMNSLAKQAELDNITPLAIVLHPWGDLTSTTVVFDNDAKKLNPVIAGIIKVASCDNPKYKVPEDYKGTVAIHRALIGYMALSRIKTVEQLKLALNPVINVGLIDLTNQIGNLHGYKITMELPDGKYFIEQTNSAGFEIRLTAIKE